MQSFWLSWQTSLDYVWLALLLMLLVYFWIKRQKIAAVRYWQKTQGQIITCEWQMKGHQLWPKIEYIYQAGEHGELTGDHFFLDATYYNPYSKKARLLAYQVAMAYKQQTSIPVFFNPENPQEAVLDQSIPPKLHFILALLTGLIGIHLVVISVRLMI